MDQTKLREILDSIPIESVAIGDDGTVTITNAELAHELQGVANQSLGEIFMAELHNLACGNNYQCGKKLTDADAAPVNQ